jgi:hypothetical protein
MWYWDGNTKVVVADGEHLSEAQWKQYLTQPCKRVKEYIADRERYIKIMTKWPWKKTDRYLDLYRQQGKWAWEQKNIDALQVLDEWENQVVEARMRKLDAEEKAQGTR